MTQKLVTLVHAIQVIDNLEVAQVDSNDGDATLVLILSNHLLGRIIKIFSVVEAGQIIKGNLTFNELIYMFLTDTMDDEDNRRANDKDYQQDLDCLP